MPLHLLVKWEVVFQIIDIQVNSKVVSPDSRRTVGIYKTKIVVLASEPVGGRSRATELPCFIYLGSWGWVLVLNPGVPTQQAHDMISTLKLCGYRLPRHIT